MSSFGEHMKMRIRTLGAWTAGILLIATAIGPTPRAEISVNADANGEFRYLSFLVPQGDQGSRNWTPVRKVDPLRVLNPQGDLYGDGAPTFLEDPTTGLPLVVWSRRGTGGSDLVWSTWEGDGWSRPSWVDVVDHPYEDRNPRLGIDAQGGIHLVWWRERERGAGTVYWSRFLPTGEWSEPTALSADFEDARHPKLGSRDGALSVRYRIGNRWSGPIPLAPATSGSGSAFLEDSARASSAEADQLTDDPDILP